MSRRFFALCFIATAVSCVRNPATGRQQLDLIPEAQEIQMGQEAAKQVSEQIGLYKDPKIQSYVAQLGQKLAAASDRPNVPYQFQVVDDGAVNAFALPGGPIFVTRGILCHLTSEAELATVVGHEIGHVAARHSANQMSKQQLAQLGLGIGSILSPTVQKLGQLASAGLSLLFLKYSRDDENQADALGYRYALGTGYDVRVMKDLFVMLQRVSESGHGGGRLPEWLATHPNPENRLKLAEERLAKAPVDPSRLVDNRDAYLKIIDGIVYGEDPRQGFFKGNSFLHPDLKFKIDLPNGWKTQNTSQAVVGVSPNQDAIFQLVATADPSPQQAAQKFFSNQGVAAADTRNHDVNGLPATSSHFQAQTQQGVIAGAISFIGYDGKTYALLGYTSPNNLAAFDPIFQQSIASFNRLTDPEALNVQPARLQLVRVTQPMTVAQFNAQHPSSVPPEEVALINGVDTNATFSPGQQVKRVVGGAPKARAVSRR